MRKLICTITTFVFIAGCAAIACAQTDYHRVELFGGYSHARMEATSGQQDVAEGGDTFSFAPCTTEGADVLGSNLQRLYCTRRGFNGFDASVTFNPRRHIGIKADVTGYFKSDQFADRFTGPGFDHTDTNTTRERTFNILGGVQFKDNAQEKKIKPFAHALVGLAHQTVRDVQTSTGTGGINFTLHDAVTSFALKLGGGLDVRLNRRVDLRVFEFDYNPIFARGRDVTGDAPFTVHVAGRRADNFTFSVGLVFH